MNIDKFRMRVKGAVCIIKQASSWCDLTGHVEVLVLSGDLQNVFIA